MEVVALDDVRANASVRSQSVVGTVNGASVDTSGFSEALVILDAGAIAATGTLDVKVQESDDGSTWVDIASAVFAQRTNATQNTMLAGRVRCGVGRRKFFRAVATQATAAVQAAVIILLSGRNFMGQSTPALSFNL